MVVQSLLPFRNWSTMEEQEKRKTLIIRQLRPCGILRYAVILVSVVDQ